MITSDFGKTSDQPSAIMASVKQGRLPLSTQNQVLPCHRKAAFEAEFGDWIAGQNAWVQAHGIPRAELRPW